MRFRDYISEAKMLPEKTWEKKLKQIDNQYRRVFKKVINAIYKDREDYYYINSWEDISQAADENVYIKHINDRYTKKWLSDYESSLEAYLSDAESRLDI